MYYSCNVCESTSTDLPNGNGAQPIFGIQLLQFGSDFGPFLAGLVPTPAESGTRSAISPDLLEAHSTLRLMTPYVAIPLLWQGNKSLRSETHKQRSAPLRCLFPAVSSRNNFCERSGRNSVFFSVSRQCQRR
jgi:hypothetical protein